MVSNGKDSFTVVTYNIKNTQLDEIEVLPGDEHVIPVNESSSISLFSPTDLLYEEFTNFKTFVFQELNFINKNFLM